MKVNGKIEKQENATEVSPLIPYVVIARRSDDKPRLIWTRHGEMDAIQMYICMGTGRKRGEATRIRGRNPNEFYMVIRLPVNGRDESDAVFKHHKYEFKDVNK